MHRLGPSIRNFVALALATVILAAAEVRAGDSGRAVRIRSSDGFLLGGSVFDPGQPGPGILLLHQCNRVGPLTGYEDLAPLLAAAGFHVLMLDSRGFGRSTDHRFSDYHAQMDLIDAKIPDDVEAAYGFLMAQPDVDERRAGVLGASCGTWQAIPLAAGHAEIRTLVFLSGSYLDLEAVVRDYEALTDRPILAIYSEGDRYRTPESMRAAFAKSRHDASKLIVYKGDLHGTPLFDLDGDLEREIVAWFTNRLLVQAPVERQAPPAGFSPPSPSRSPTAGRPSSSRP